MQELLIFIAPIFQIIISTLKITWVISVPLFLIFAATILVGFVLSFSAMRITLDETTGLDMHCGTPGIAILFAGVLITLITSPIILLFFYLINRSISRNEIAVK
jgi:hypothetical protein